MSAADAARAIEKLELTCAVEFLTLPTAAFAEETLPYSAAGLVDLLHQKAKVTELSYEDGGIVAQAVVDEQVFGKIRDYVVTE